VWSELPHPAAPLLSVRTGWDLLLQSWRLPAGSEVLMSAFTIPDMAEIVRANQLTPVPVDLKPGSYSPCTESLRRAVSPRSRVLLAAELFGERYPLDELADFAERHNLALVADLAQAYTGQLTLPAGAAAALYSFGPIKTATALGGAVIVMRDAELAEQVIEREQRYPWARRSWFAARVCKHAALKAASTKPAYGAVVRWLQRGGRDMDQSLSAAVKNFSADELLRAVRRRAPAPLLRLLDRKLRQDYRQRTNRRAAAAEEVVAAAGSRIWRRAESDHSFWLVPVVTLDPEELVKRLRGEGFDAVQIRSLDVVPPPHSRDDVCVDNARAALFGTVFVPSYPDMPTSERRRLADCLSGVQVLPVEETIASSAVAR
jgi:dTDP-4-amino-4,6-dideoxygalactose transaminase